MDPTEERRLLDLLASIDQLHLLDGLDTAARSQLFEHVRHLDNATTGGLSSYVTRARRLLLASERGENPFAGWTLSIPEGERLSWGDSRYQQLETRGHEEFRSTVFVLVAGGLGERLGYSGIKLALPVSTLTGECYLRYYCQHIFAFQCGCASSIPLVIMTSGDTHEKTLALLSDNNFFGLAQEQVILLRQEEVPCLVDGEAHLARDPNNSGRLQTKPHGHGDVHALLHTSGQAKRFLQKGKKWLCFFQDTNALLFKVIASVVGVSAEKRLHMNSVAVPRQPRDAMGSIARIAASDGTCLTLNVEYNQLESFLKSTICPEGDVANDTGFSPFPGNMNSFVLSLRHYVETLERTAGVIAEFVNPKYADASRTTFKSSTRLECMMQDLPREFGSEASVGFTVFERWCSYSPVKNSQKVAVEKTMTNNHPQCATTGETDLFHANCQILRMAGADIEGPRPAQFNGVAVELDAMVLWSASWACSFRGVQRRLDSGALAISHRSTLILEGDITIKNLNLDGALIIRAAPGTRVHILKLSVVNEGWTLNQPEPGAGEVENMRGFCVQRQATREMVFSSPGDVIVDET